MGRESGGGRATFKHGQVANREQVGAMTSTPLDRMSEDELVERARQTMGRAASLPVGSLGRSIQWGVFDTLMAELDRRAIRYRLPRLERYGRL